MLGSVQLRRLESWVANGTPRKREPPQITTISYEGFDAQSGLWLALKRVVPDAGTVKFDMEHQNRLHRSRR